MFAGLFKRASIDRSFDINEDRVGDVKKQMKSDEVMGDLAATFKVLGDPTRTKIIFALSKKVLCVGEISALLNISQSAISHQLRVLRDMSLVRLRRDGKTIYYALDDVHIKYLLKEGLNHVLEE